MVVGAIALFVYAKVVSRLLAHGRTSALKATVFAMPVWFGIAFLGWAMFLR